MCALRIVSGSANHNIRSMAPANTKLISVEFEVFGKVQSCSFRMYAVGAANQYKVRGWIKNTEDGTVKGYLEGPEAGVERMKNWLQFTGSPCCKIDKTVYDCEKEIQEYTEEKFVMHKVYKCT